MIPQAGFVQDPTDVMGRRIAAYLVDVILVAIVAFGAFAVSGARDDVLRVEFATRTQAERYCDSFSGGVCVPSERDALVIDDDDVGKVTGTLFGGAAAVWILNWWLLQSITGGSVGKLLVGLRVVKPDGRRAGLGSNAVRTILLIVDAACCAIIGLVTAFTTKGHRRVGDMAAKTLVVQSSAVGQPVAVPGLTAPEAAPFASSGWPPPGTGYGPPAGGGYGAPTTPPPGAATGGWSVPPSAEPVPEQPPSGSETSQGAGASLPGVDGPHWDDARGAYIQYDHDRGAWLQWDDTAKEWKQI